MDHNCEREARIPSPPINETKKPKTRLFCSVYDIWFVRERGDPPSPYLIIFKPNGKHIISFSVVGAAVYHINGNPCARLMVLHLYLAEIVFNMPMSDEGSFEEQNLINTVLFHKSKLKKIQKGVSAGKLFTNGERRKLREYGILIYRKKIWELTEKARKVIETPRRP